VFRLYKGVYDENNMDLQQLHEWARTNGLKLNQEKSQVILIHRCRADIPPPTVLIGANVVHQVVSRVRNLGFVSNERLTATDHFTDQTPFEVKRGLVLSLILPHVNYGNIVFTAILHLEKMAF
jgi:hypothetical protein